MDKLTYRPPVCLQPWVDSTVAPLDIELLVGTIARDISTDVVRGFSRQGFVVDAPPMAIPKPSLRPKTYATTHLRHKAADLYLDPVCCLDTRHLVYSVTEKLLAEGTTHLADYYRLCNRLCLLSQHPDVYTPQFYCRFNEFTYQAIHLEHQRWIKIILEEFNPDLIHQTDFLNLITPNPAYLWLRSDKHEVYEFLAQKLPFATFSVRSVAAIWNGSVVTEFSESGALSTNYFTDSEFNPEQVGDEVRVHYFRRKLRLLID